MPCAVDHNRMSMWLSFHIFYSGSIDQLITALITPVVLPLRQQGLVQTFFYIRYHELGPHIRLRLLPVDGAAEAVTAQLQQQINGFLSAHPASRTALEQQYPGYISAQWYPEGTIQAIAYIPETVRYGGAVNLPFCEVHFMCSTIAAAQLLMTEPVISSGKKLLYAMLLAVQFVKNCVPEGMAAFFRAYYQEWLGTALRITGVQQEAELVQQFEKAYAAQQVILNTIFEDAANITWGDAVDGVLHSWSNGNSILSQQLQASGLPAHELLSVYRSVLHMTFNRLGIRNEEECYITWMLARYLFAAQN